MRIFTAVSAALSLLLCVSSVSAQNPEERARLDWVLERGKLLFEVDRAAWVGTDDMSARIPDAASTGMRGYIVERDGNGFVVTFYGGPTEAPVAHYQARVENRRVAGSDVFDSSARPPLTPLQRRLVAAREMASDLGRRPCGEAAFNTALIAPQSPEGVIDLYLLTPQVAVGEYPLGGHYRFTIDADGSVASSREFARTCLLMRSEDAPADSRPVAMGVTHLLDPIPTEIHVFTALTSGLPVAVGTGSPERAWWVTGESIELMPSGSEFAPPVSAPKPSREEGK